MRADEKAFIAKMGVLSGPDFEAVVRYSLLKVLGESPSEVLLMTLSGRALRDPRVFLKAVSQLFGRGAQAICLSLEGYAAEALSAEREAPSENSTYSDLAGAVGRSGGPAAGGELRPRRLLHDQRIKDESGEYATDAG